MVVRRRRKKNKLRGQRTHGGGGTKNRRGAGSRGGVGRAGSHKHKFSKYYVDFGVKKTLKSKNTVVAINLDDITQKLDAWVENGKATKEQDMVILDGKILGFGKVLGRGVVKAKIKLKNADTSKKAEEKIIEAGGTIERREEGKEQAKEESKEEKEETSEEKEGEKEE